MKNKHVFKMWPSLQHVRVRSMLTNVCTVDRFYFFCFGCYTGSVLTVLNMKRKAQKPILEEVLLPRDYYQKTKDSNSLFSST